MKTYGEEGRRTAAHTLNLDTRSRWVSASRPYRFTPEKYPPVLFGRCDEEKNLFPLPGIEPRFFGRPARSLVTIVTELSHLPVLETEGKKIKSVNKGRTGGGREEQRIE
jgi:hypothetical protein